MEKKFFQQLTLELPKTQAEDCGDLLQEWTALAVTYEDARDDAIFEPSLGTTPLWTHTKITALFEQDCDLEPIRHMLATTLPPSVFATLRTEIIPDKDWIRASLDQFKPQRFGTRFWVCPSWCEADFKRQIERDTVEKQIGAIKNQNDAIEPVIMLLDPGLAFGTGSHPTTRLCLQWIATHDMKDKIVLDYGCGSGILGIAAFKLGAKQLIAVDHDPQALSSTTANAELNHVIAAQINCLLPQGMSGVTAVDVVLANILANPLIELAPKLSAMLVPAGQIILSGVLESQTDSVIQAYQPFMQDFIVEHDDGWVSIQATRKTL